MISSPAPSKYSSLTLAFLSSLGATFMLACMIAASKLASPYYTPVEVAFWRNFIGLIPITIVALHTFGPRVPPMAKPAAMLWRASLGSLSLTLSFSAYAALPMADANAIILSASLVLMILAHFFLKERITRVRAGAIIIGLIGVMIIVQPTGMVSPHGAMIAVSAALCLAVMRTLLRHLGKTENPISMTFYFMLGGTVLTALPLFWVGHWPTLDTFWMLALVGICGVTGQYLNSISYTHGDASFLSVMVYTQLLFSIPFDYFLWDHAPAIHTLIGGAIIIASNVGIALYERNRSNLK